MLYRDGGGLIRVSSDNTAGAVGQLAVGQLAVGQKTVKGFIDVGVKKLIKKEDEEMLRELQRMRERLLRENRALEALIGRLGKGIRGRGDLRI